MNVSRETIEEMIFNEFVNQARLLGFKIIVKRDKTAIKMCLIASVCLERGLY